LFHRTRLTGCGCKCDHYNLLILVSSHQPAGTACCLWACRYLLLPIQLKVLHGIASLLAVLPTDILGDWSHNLGTMHSFRDQLCATRVALINKVFRWSQF